MGAAVFLLVAGGVLAAIIATACARTRRDRTSGTSSASCGTGFDGGYIDSSDGGVSMGFAGGDASGDSHTCDAGGSDSGGTSDCGSSDAGGGSD